MSFRHTYVLRFPCSFLQVGRRVSIVHAHVYVHIRIYVSARTPYCTWMWWCVHVSRIGYGPRSYLEIQFRVIYIDTRAQFIYRREIERSALFELYKVMFYFFAIRTDGKNSYLDETKEINEILIDFLSCNFIVKNKVY